MAFPHAGLPVVRFEALGSPPDKCAAPRGECGAGVPSVPAHDRGVLAVCGAGRVICAAPAAGGLSGVGSGAQDPAECVLLVADHLGLCAVRGRQKAEGSEHRSEVRVQNPSSIFYLLSSISLLLRPGTDVQTGSGHSSLCAFAAGLLAAAPAPALNCQRSTSNALAGEGPFSCPGRGVECDYPPGPPRSGQPGVGHDVALEHAP